MEKEVILGAIAEYLESLNDEHNWKVDRYIQGFLEEKILVPAVYMSQEYPHLVDRILLPIQEELDEV